MYDCIIKICGIRDADMAKQTARAGANLIGLIFHPSSPRYVNLEQATAIADATRLGGALPVAVFVNHSDFEMQHICETANIQIVQLHGAMARAHHHLLPKHYQRIYVQNVLEDGVIKKDDGLQYLDKDRDLILLDHVDPGKGKSISKLSFNYDLPFPWILAGGLTPDNVASTIKKLNPNGVDVSSGVESSKGNKDILLIKKFIKAVRGL